MEHTNGKLEYSVLDGTQTPATLFINHDGDELDIAVFEKWETDWAKEEMQAIAKKLRRRWNAFEEGGMVEELRKACKIGLNKALGISTVALDLGAKITPKHKKDIEIIEAALAKSQELSVV